MNIYIYIKCRIGGIAYNLYYQYRKFLQHHEQSYRYSYSSNVKWMNPAWVAEYQTGNRSRISTPHLRSDSLTCASVRDLRQAARCFGPSNTAENARALLQRRKKSSSHLHLFLTCRLLSFLKSSKYVQYIHTIATLHNRIKVKQQFNSTVRIDADYSTAVVYRSIIIIINREAGWTWISRQDTLQYAG